MARITPCLENGKVAYVNFLDENEIAFGSTEYIVMTAKDGHIPELLYFLCRDNAFKDYATKNMNGSSGRQRVSGDVIGKYKIAIPPKSVLESIANYYKNVMDVTRRNGLEMINLAQLRDSLLPKLMSGEITI
jgi:type I restriction enzyme S subunit